MRLSGAMRRIAAPTTAQRAAALVTWETVQDVYPDGTCLVRDVRLPLSGLATATVGERVAVGWRDGRPATILAHSWQRATFARTFRGGALGLVEELAIANLDDSGADVWYRNHERIEKLGVVASLQGHAPAAVKWGLDGRSFVVQCANEVYAVFALDRDDADALAATAPGTASLVRLWKPLDTDTPLVTVVLQNAVRRDGIEFIGSTRDWNKYVAVRSYWFDGGIWYWSQMIDRREYLWESDRQCRGSASVSVTQAFGLRDMLAGRISDFYGHKRASASVLDYYLGADRKLRFLLAAEWDYFVIGTMATAKGTLTWPVVPHYWGHGWGPLDEDVWVGGTALTVIGAKRQDQQPVSERHLVLFDGDAQAVEWASCANGVNVRRDARSFAAMLLDHLVISDPGYDNSLLPNPHHEGSQAPSTTEGYYRGANWNEGTALMDRDAGIVGEDRAVTVSSTGTHQLFDPSRLSALSGPYITESQAVDARTASIRGGGSSVWRVKYQVRTGGQQRLWHYRMAEAAVIRGKTAVQVFAVVERYPFVPQTNYITEIPQVGIFLLATDGTVRHTFREFSYGLAGGRVVTGNAHRLLWKLRAPWMQPKETYRMTYLDTGAEQTLSEAQVAAFLQTQAQLYPPDFCFDRASPEAFYMVDSLPDIAEDSTIKPHATLAPSDAQGDIRIVNDPTVLDGLDRYQTA